STNHGSFCTLGDLLHGCEVAFRRDWKAGLDNVNAHVVEELGHFELLLVSHGRAGALLPVTQSGVEDDDAVLIGLSLGNHENDPSPRMRRLGALWGCSFPRVPRVPRHECPAGPQGRIRRRSEPRMRVAAEPARAVRSIARIFERVDMAFEQPSSSITLRVAET